MRPPEPPLEIAVGEGSNDLPRPPTVDTTVVIASRNRPSLLLDAVRSVLDGQHVPGEILIVDQSDTVNEALADVAQIGPCRVHYVRTAPKGVSAARNAGARAARHDLLIFMDDDMLAAKTWLTALRSAFVRLGPDTVITGQVAPAAMGDLVPSIKTDPIPATYEGRVGADVLYSGNMAISRRIFEAIGGFDVRLGPGTAFPAAEDNDFGFRLLESGHSIAYVPDAVVYHRDWRTRAGHVALQWRYGVGQGAFYAKHLQLPDRYMLGRALRDVAAGAARVLNALARRPAEAAAEVAYVCGLLTGAACWLSSVRLLGRRRPSGRASEPGR